MSANKPGALAARDTGGNLQLVLAELITLLEQDGWDRSQAHELYRRALSLGTRLSAEAAKDWPFVAEWVGKYRDNLFDMAPWKQGVKSIDVRQSLTNLDHLVESWFRNPELKKIPQRPPYDTPLGERY